MAKIKWRFFTPKETLSRVKKELALAKLLEEVITSYNSKDTFVSSVHSNIASVVLPDSYTVEDCWRFIDYIENYFNVDYSKNRPHYDKQDNAFDYWIDIDNNNQIWIENCKEHCIIEYKDVEIPEQTIPAHIEKKTVIKCLDNDKLIIGSA